MEYCDYLALQSKHLYNSANYVQRQYFFESGKYFNPIEIYHQTKDLESYRYLPTKVSKQIVRRVSEAWKGWKAATKEWLKHPEKFLGKPKIPGYKHKERGRYVVIYPIDALSKPALTKGLVKLSQTSIEFPTLVENVNQVRIVPKLDHYVIEVVYTVTEPARSLSGYAASVDLGLNNLMAVTSNHPGLKPLLINGKPLKSINQFFNKRVAALQSAVRPPKGFVSCSTWGDPKTALTHRATCGRKGKRTKRKEASKQIKALNSKRNRRIENYLHTVSRRVIDWCSLQRISQLIIGNNQGWKQDLNIGKRNNQQFTKIPHAKLIHLLQYKGQLAGIEVLTTEESYTSKASALDQDSIPVYQAKSEVKPIFSGKRIKRGLYRSGTGKLISDAARSWGFPP